MVIAEILNFKKLWDKDKEKKVTIYQKIAKKIINEHNLQKCKFAIVDEHQQITLEWYCTAPVPYKSSISTIKQAKKRRPPRGHLTRRKSYQLILLHLIYFCPKGD